MLPTQKNHPCSHFHHFKQHHRSHTHHSKQHLHSHQRICIPIITSSILFVLLHYVLSKQIQQRQRYFQSKQIKQRSLLQCSHNATSKHLLPTLHYFLQRLIVEAILHQHSCISWPSRNWSNDFSYETFRNLPSTVKQIKLPPDVYPPTWDQKTTIENIIINHASKQSGTLLIRGRSLPHRLSYYLICKYGRTYYQRHACAR